MPKLLMYNIEKRKSIEIKNLCRKLNISYFDVDKSDYSLTLECLLELSKDNSKGEGVDFNEEMLLLADFGEGIFNLFLSLLRKKKCTVALKAVLTDTNKSFTSYELYSEISKEHEAMTKGETYHQA
jgi:hypothetical protein